MAKIAFDKYYTPPTVARWCIEKTKEIIGEENITEWIEPSAGCGMFSHQIEGCKAYDLYPQHEYIEQADFLSLDLGGYKKGRLFIGNPPFGGSGGIILKSFYDKCCDNGDYIAFIQPAALYNNYKKFYRFEIVYSCLLKTEYTNKNLWTSFTIYKKNPDKEDFRDHIEKINFKDISFIKIGRSNKRRENHKKNLDYDYCFTSFGTIFRESKPYETSGQILIKVNNIELKHKVITFFKWLYKFNKETEIMSRKCVGSQNVDMEDLKRLIKICIPELK
jgi:hypothetical protein